MREFVFRALYPFGGLGGGALGQSRCHARLLGWISPDGHHDSEPVSLQECLIQ